MADRRRKQPPTTSPGTTRLPMENQDEVVEFHSEMPKVPDDQVDFVPDEQLEDEIEDVQ